MDLSRVLIPIGRAVVPAQSHSGPWFSFIQAQKALITCLPRYQATDDRSEACWLFSCHDPMCLHSKRLPCNSSFGTTKDKEEFEKFFSVNEKTFFAIANVIADQASRYRKFHNRNPEHYIIYGKLGTHAKIIYIMPLHANNKVPPYKFFIQSLPLKEKP